MWHAFQQHTRGDEGPRCRGSADVLHWPGVGRPPPLAHLPSLGPRAIRNVTRFSGPGAATRGKAELTRRSAVPQLVPVATRSRQPRSSPPSASRCAGHPIPHYTVCPTVRFIETKSPIKSIVVRFCAFNNQCNPFACGSKSSAYSWLRAKRGSGLRERDREMSPSAMTTPRWEGRAGEAWGGRAARAHACSHVNVATETRLYTNLDMSCMHVCTQVTAGHGRKREKRERLMIAGIHPQIHLSALPVLGPFTIHTPPRVHAELICA